jgi:hypothetical protein
MEQTAIEHAMSNYDPSRSYGKFSIHADDPINEITAMVAKIEGVNDIFTKAVAESKEIFSNTLAQSVDIVGKKLETQFSLVSKPVLESVAEQQGTLGAVQQQLASLEKRFINTGHVNAPSHNWNIWLQLGCVFMTLGLVGYNTVTSRDSIWAQTSAGKTAKQIVALNPKLANNCRPLSAKDRSKLGREDKSTKVCSIFL